MFKYYSNSKSWEPAQTDGLKDMIKNGVEIPREIFIRHVDEEDVSMIEENLEGSIDLVTYYISKINDEPVYYLKYSNIEYVFKQG